MFLRNLLQPEHLIVILVLVFVFFGIKRLPLLGKSMKNAVKEFKDNSVPRPPPPPIDPATQKMMAEFKEWQKFQNEQKAEREAKRSIWHSFGTILLLFGVGLLVVAFESARQVPTGLIIGTAVIILGFIIFLFPRVVRNN
jgi:TatA/E family protein of Tat protein translocase